MVRDWAINNCAIKGGSLGGRGMRAMVDQSNRGIHIQESAVGESLLYLGSTWPPPTWPSTTASEGDRQKLCRLSYS